MAIEEKSRSKLDLMPTVTVLMPVYNAAPYVRLAIESILEQTYADFELLIIDDGSTDTSQEVIRSYADPRIRLLENGENQGLTRTLNAGLEAARAELIARQDADDLSLPRRLEKQVAFMEAHPAIALLGTQALQIDHRGRYRGTIDHSLETAGLRWELLFGNAFVHSSVMYRRKIVWRELGGYSEAFPFAEDYELWSRVASSHSVANLPDRLVAYRVHASAQKQRFREQQSLLGQIAQRNFAQTFGPEIFSTAAVDEIFRYMQGAGSGADCWGDWYFELLTAYAKRYPGIVCTRGFQRMLVLQWSIAIYQRGSLGIAFVWGGVLSCARISLWLALSFPRSCMRVMWQRLICNGAKNLIARFPGQGNLRHRA